MEGKIPPAISRICIEEYAFIIESFLGVVSSARNRERMVIGAFVCCGTHISLREMVIFSASFAPS